MNYTLKEACRMNQNFDVLADLLKTEMEGRAFRTNDYPTLKIKYEFLTEILNIIKNETIEENEL